MHPEIELAVKNAKRDAGEYEAKIRTLLLPYSDPVAMIEGILSEKQIGHAVKQYWANKSLASSYSED